MAADRLTQIEIAYHAARDRHGEDRSRVLDEVCGADIGMRQQIEALLRQDSSANSLLDRPAIEAVLEPTPAAPQPDLSGTRIGVYEILERIGSGGMGVVYRARDTKLDRLVAIKILPELFALDPERLVRFGREAKALASVNHPNIAIVHGLEETPGTPALVMEFVDGPTLADRIAQAPILLFEALSIAKQITQGLEAAHEQNIIHRDLKPANVKVRPDGTVKVLDFGLAKALEPTSTVGGDATASPTITSAAMISAMGAILGTAAYMSPEQARGHAVDKRTDIWAFGCVLYEMLTGRTAFARETVSDTLAAILDREPDWAALPASTHVAIRRLLERCLDKDPRRRLRDIGDARFALDEHMRRIRDEIRDRVCRLLDARGWRRSLP